RICKSFSDCRVVNSFVSVSLQIDSRKLLSHSVNSAPRFRSRFATARNSARALRMRSISRHEANVFPVPTAIQCNPSGACGQAPLIRLSIYHRWGVLVGATVRIATGLSQYTTQIDLGALW